MFRPEIDPIWTIFRHGAWCVPVRAADILAGESVGVSVFWFAGKVKVNLHSAGISTVFA
jgi:hypothetical protein